MKKKLLTVLLAVVMVFGVFGLTACKSSNPDADYNYYGIKYEIEDVKIEALTYQGFYRAMTTPGNYVIYVATEGQGGASKADFQNVNKLAADWGITIYHFNPELSGGYASDLSNAVSTNILAGKIVDKALKSDLGKVYNNAMDITVDKWADVTDNKLIAVTGVAPTWKIESGTAVQYFGSYSSYTGTWSSPIKSIQSVADGAKAIAAISTKVPSYGVNAEGDNVPYVPAAYNTTGINTINLFADARLHMYDEAGDIKAAKEDVFVTVANYAMFAHLMANNEGCFPVFFGGTWCGNTQAIVKATNGLAKDYGIEKIYFFDPRLEDGTKVETAKVVSSMDWDKAEMVQSVSVTDAGAYLASNLNTRNGDASTDAAYNFNFLYGKFLDEYLPTYISEWNVNVYFNITVGDTVLKKTKMCVPNIMMFNGEAEGKAELVALAEAEYTYANVNEEGNPQQVEWDKAVKAVFDANPYASYAPVLVAAPAPEASAPAAGGSSASASEGGC